MTHSEDPTTIARQQLLPLFDALAFDFPFEAHIVVDRILAVAQTLSQTLSADRGQTQ